MAESTAGTTDIFAGNQPGAWVVEVEGELFRPNSAVFMPTVATAASGIPPQDAGASVFESLKVVFRFLGDARAADRTLLLTGHTDAPGGAEVSPQLSKKWANSIEWMLLGDEASRTAWARQADASHHLHDIPHILQWATLRGWNTDPGPLDGSDTAKFGKAVVEFHKRCTLDLGLNLSGATVNEGTWTGVFALYQDELRARLKAEISEMDSLRGALRWVHPVRHAVGCGNNWPVDRGADDKYRSKTNRRVEVLLLNRANATAASQCEPCRRDRCPAYGTAMQRRHLPAVYGARPVAQPTWMAPESPGSGSKLMLQSLNAYVAVFSASGNLRTLRRYKLKDGKLTDYNGAPVDVECGTETYLYFSHRPELAYLNKAAWFKKDKTGLPLLGPMTIAAATGNVATIDIDIWGQNDWFIVRGEVLDGQKVDEVMLVEWSEDYFLFWDPSSNDIQLGGRYIWGDPVAKELQEHWLSENGGGRPLRGARPSTPLEAIARASLALLAPSATVPLFAGTLSALPVGGTASRPPPRSEGELPLNPGVANGKGKALLIKSTRGVPGEKHAVGSFNELVRAASNRVVTHHTYDGAKVDALLALGPNPDNPIQINAMATPARFLLPGDVCWATQERTPNCGPFSFAAAMNYWYPFSNHPWVRGGKEFNELIGKLPGGARPPGYIVEAAPKFGMNARTNTGGRLDAASADKLIKLWLVAGVPVMFLVVEGGGRDLGLPEWHWKLAVGYDGDRLFMENSGADKERRSANPAPAYLSAPVGNDVDLFRDHDPKWEQTTHGLFGTGAEVLTSVATRSFIPVYPIDARFRGVSVT